MNYTLKNEHVPSMQYYFMANDVNIYHLNLKKLYLQSLDVVSRYSDPQFQVGVQYTNISVNFEPIILRS